MSSNQIGQGRRPFRPSGQAPYGSPRAFLRFLEEAGRWGWPERLDEGFLERAGLRGGSLWELRVALRFLGLMDEWEDRRGERYSIVFLPEAGRRRALAEAVRQSYAPLWQALDVTRASREELVEAFRRIYSPELAERQARFFIGLCQAAGISLAARLRPRRERRRPQAKAPPVAPPAAREREEPAPPAGEGRERPRGEEPMRAPQPSPATVDGEARAPLDWRGRYLEVLLRRLERADPREAYDLESRIESLIGVETGRKTGLWSALLRLLGVIKPPPR